jgi:hypothetical protein
MALGRKCGTLSAFLGARLVGYVNKYLDLGHPSMSPKGVDIHRYFVFTPSCGNS